MGGDNYFAHPEGDEQSRRFALTTSLMENGHVRARDLEQPPLLIPHRTLMNWTKPCRREGPSSFYRTAHHPKARVMTPDKNAECAQLMAEGITPSDVARRAGINESTLRKALKREAIPQGRAGVPRRGCLPGIAPALTAAPFSDAFQATP